MNEDNFIQDLIANRIGGNKFGKDTKIYKFEKIKRAKKAAISKNPGVELIDMGVGEPDAMAVMNVVEELYKEAKKPENRGYADNGIEDFKVAAIKYMKNVFGVDGLTKNNINHAIGSKPALAMIPQAFINPGDITIMTVPGYPIMGTMTKWLGGEVVNLPLLEKNNFLPDLDSLNDNQKKRAKLLYINYPNNPTGATATKEFYEKVINFAKKNNIIVVSDLAYGALTFDDEKPLSLLSVNGGKDICVELHSLSKAFNMTGWRLAFAVGNELIIKAFANVKDNNDSGQFIPIQKAGIYCLSHPEITIKTSKKYSRRHEMIVKVLKELGFNVKKPKGSFYLYVKAPKGIKGGKMFNSAEDFSQWLITEKLISTVPWDDAGAYIRFSMTFDAKDENEEKKIAQEIKNRLSDVEFIF